MVSCSIVYCRGLGTRILTCHKTRTQRVNLSVYGQPVHIWLAKNSIVNLSLNLQSVPA